MANHFVDGVNGSDSYSGHTMDAAWLTVKKAISAGALTAGDIVWVRRNVDESGDKTGDYTCTYSGTPVSPIMLLGWPRNLSSFTSASWTAGSTTVDSVIGLSLARAKHLGRYITGPDGVKYLITEVLDSDTFLIDCEYAGTTVTSTDGAATILADTEYALSQAIDDSAWTIKVSDWTGDADDLPIIGFGTSNYNMYFSSDASWEIKNLSFLDGGDAYGILRIYNCNTVYLEGCLFKNTNGTRIAYFEETWMQRCIFESNATYTYPGPSFEGCIVVDCALYNQNGSSAISGNNFFSNVNINVEGSKTCAFSLYLNDSTGNVVCFNCKSSDGTLFMGGVTANYTSRIRGVSENHQKILGAHYCYGIYGRTTKVDVVDGSGDPYKRSSGSDSVMICDFDGIVGDGKTSLYDATILLEHEFAASTASSTYRYYIQSEGAITSGDLWLEAEYVNGYTDTTAYTITRETATGAIAARSGVSDWGEYLEITVQPAVASKVRIKLFCNYYHATNVFYVDPVPVVT